MYGEKKSWYRRWWAIVLFIIVGIIILSVIFGNNDSSVPSQPKNISSNPVSNNVDPYTGLVHNNKLVILESESVIGEYGNLEIDGTAQNIAGRELSYAQIDAKFYDEEGALLDSSLTNINNFASGEKWKFKIMYIGIDAYNVQNYSLSIGSSW